MDHVLRGAGVVAGVRPRGGRDDELDHSGVGRRHPQRLRVPARQRRGDRHTRAEVHHSVVVVPDCSFTIPYFDIHREILYRSALKWLRTSHLPLLMSFHSMLQAVRSPFYSFR